MILLAKLIGLKSEQDLWPSLKVSQVVRKVLSLVDCEDTLGRLTREFGCESVLKTMPEDVLHFLNSSFLPVETRPSPGDLLKALQGKINEPFCFKILEIYHHIITGDLTAEFSQIFFPIFRDIFPQNIFQIRILHKFSRLYTIFTFH